MPVAIATLPSYESASRRLNWSWGSTPILKIFFSFQTSGACDRKFGPWSCKCIHYMGPLSSSEPGTGVSIVPLCRPPCICVGFRCSRYLPLPPLPFLYLPFPDHRRTDIPMLAILSSLFLNALKPKKEARGLQKEGWASYWGWNSSEEILGLSKSILIHWLNFNEKENSSEAESIGLFVDVVFIWGMRGL